MMLYAGCQNHTKNWCIFNIILFFFNVQPKLVTLFQSILIYYIVASELYGTGAIFHILWPYEDLSSSSSRLRWYMYFIHDITAAQRLETPEMQLNFYCSFSADRSLVEELYSVGFFMTLSVMII